MMLQYYSTYRFSSCPTTKHVGHEHDTSRCFEVNVIDGPKPAGENIKMNDLGVPIE